MRVLHVIPSVAPRYGGPSYAVTGFCRALNARGVDTVIATTNADGEGVLPVPIGQATTYEGLNAIFFERRGEAFKYSAGLSQWLRAAVTTFDVVHVHAVFSHSSLAAGRACRSRDVPYVVRPLGSLDPWSLTQRAWEKRLLLHTSARALIHDAAAIHFTAPEEQRLAAPVTGSVPAAVIPPGIEARYAATALTPFARRAPRVLAMSRLDRKKRLDRLIHSFHAAASRPGCEDWTLTIAGDGDAAYRTMLERAAGSGPASSRIEFVGWVDGERKHELLARSSLFAMPSHQENFGLALLEALACGLPAIVSPGVNLAASIADAGAGWVIGEDPAELSETLHQAMTDLAQQSQRGHAARRLATEFSWERAGEQLEALYAVIGRATAAGRR